MKKTITITVVFLFLASFTSREYIANGWFKAGSKPDKYIMGIDSNTFKKGKKSAYIKSIDKEIEGFGTLMQTCNAINYLDKKVKMTGYMKTEKVNGRAGLWFRVDGKTKNSLSFDNMRKQPVSGTTEWEKYEIILDVPKNSATMNYGALLRGTGTLWFDEISFEIIGEANKRLVKPTNTNFEN